jgi:hypothetical protein
MSFLDLEQSAGWKALWEEGGLGQAQIEGARRQLERINCSHDEANVLRGRIQFAELLQMIVAQAAEKERTPIEEEAKEARLRAERPWVRATGPLRTRIDRALSKRPA